MNLPLVSISIHLISGALLFLIVTPTVELISALAISAFYTSFPLIFYKYRRSSFLKIDAPTTLPLFISIAIPIAMLTIDRITSGFTITWNPVTMRDQMLARSQLLGGSTIYSVIGNLSQLGAYFYISKHFLFQHQSRLCSIFSLLFFGFIIWLAGSRAFLLVAIIVFWGFSGFPTPKLRHTLGLASIFIALISIFYLRSERSEIIFSDYLFTITNHLRVPLNKQGEQIIDSFAGPAFLAFAYIAHSIIVLSEIIFSPPHQGYATATFIHLLSSFSIADNSGYKFEGLFTTSAGMILHDFGWLGFWFALVIKSLTLYYCSKLKKYSTASVFSALLAIDSVTGLWTSIINILLAIPLSIGLILAAITHDIQSMRSSKKKEQTTPLRNSILDMI